MHFDYDAQLNSKQFKMQYQLKTLVDISNNIYNPEDEKVSALEVVMPIHLKNEQIMKN